MQMSNQRLYPHGDKITSKVSGHPHDEDPLGGVGDEGLVPVRRPQAAVIVNIDVGQPIKIFQRHAESSRARWIVVRDQRVK